MSLHTNLPPVPLLYELLEEMSHNVEGKVDQYV